MRTIQIIALTIGILTATSSYGQRKVYSILPPPGFERVETDAYGTFMRSLPLKRAGTPVKLYDGRIKGYQDGP